MMRVGGWPGSLVVLAALLMARAVMARGVADDDSVSVILAHRCSVCEMAFRVEGDGREIFVHYSANGQSVVNGELLLPVETDLRRAMRGWMATRAEQAIYFDADRELSYGEVERLLRQLKEDFPELHFLLLTNSQMEQLAAESKRLPDPYRICTSPSV